MTDENCGCGCPGTPKPDMYLMAASPASASTCGTGQTPGTDPAVECLLSEPTYDVTVGDFGIPLSEASVLVCDGSLYTLGQWIQFIHDGSILKIVAIAINSITLRNTCDDGGPIEGNSNTGTAIPAGSPFIVVDAPECKSEEEKTQEFEAAVAGATELCMPGLTTNTSLTSKMQLLGWRALDATIPSLGNCIQWLSGIWRQNNSLYINPIEESPAFETAGVNGWYPLVIDANGEIRKQKNPMQSPNITAGKWVPTYDASKLYMVGPAFIFSPVVPVNIYKNNGAATTITDEATWPIIAADPAEFISTPNLSSNLTGINIPGAKLYAVIHLNLGVDHNATGAAKVVSFEINGVEKLAVGCSAASKMFNSCILFVELDAAVKTFTFKVRSRASGNAKYLVSMDLLGFML
jgi:hypothetical protein